MNGTKASATYTPTVLPVTTFVDKEGKAIPGYPTEDNEQPKKEIPGYRFVETKKLPNGDTEHVYEKVKTNHKDKEGNEIPGYPIEDGENPNRLNVNVDNAEKLGGMLPSYYAKADSPTFTGIVKVPDVTIGGNANSPVTIKLLEDYVAKQILNKAYPIGSIYLTFSTLDPSTILGGGEWRKVSTGKMLISSGIDYPLRSTGGEKDHILTTRELPAHSHRVRKSSIQVDTSNMMQDHYHATGTTENNNGVQITRPNKEKIPHPSPKREGANLLSEG